MSPSGSSRRPSQGTSPARSRCTRPCPRWRRRPPSNARRPKSLCCASARCPRRASCCAAWPSPTAATLVALKLAWRKFFALLAIGRRAEDMVTTFQLGTLFDHYCSKLHVGGEIDRDQAMLLRTAIFAALAESERAALIGAFQEGGRVLGRSALEAPSWMSARIERAARRW